MKKLITSLFALAVMATASAQMNGNQARVYAYDLNVNNETKVVTFKTNTVAKTAKVIIDGITEEITATSTDGKNWTATIEPTTEFSADVEYNWSVEVSAPAVQSFTEVYNSGNNGFDLYRSYGLVVDQSPESKYFGRAYMAHQATSGSNVPVGMYTFTPELMIENGGNPYTACDMIGINEATAGTSPADMCISDDGRIFMSNTSSAYYGVYYINPDNFSNSAVFQNITRDANNYIVDKTTGEHVAGKSAGVTTRGYGNETVLITADNTYYSTNYAFSLNNYNIGSNNSWNGAPTSIYGNGTNKLPYLDAEGKTNKVSFLNANHSLDATTNGIWVVQNRTTPALSNPTLFYYSEKTGHVEYFYIDATSNKSAALAVNESLGLVAHTIVNDANATIMQYTEDNEGHITMNQISKGNDMASLGSKADAMDFDYAGNLYAVTSGNEIMSVYALPDALVGPNTRVTPAKKSLTISFTQGEIEATGIESIEAANAPVEYYNLQGVKVENPSNGIFIKKQGGRTSKVVL